MSFSQRRLGPYNLGTYGILSSIINGLNLILTQLIIVKIQLYYGFQLFPILFFIISFIHYYITYPSSLIGIILTLFIVIIIASLIIYFLSYVAIALFANYSLISVFRLIGQRISFELVFTIVLCNIIYKSFSFSLTDYNMNNTLPYFKINTIYNIIITLLLSLITSFIISFINIISFIIIIIIAYIIYYLYLLFHYNTINLSYFINILVDSNRVPFDLLEAESELIAGFIIDYSSIYFSLILLTEYGNIIIHYLLLTILLFIYPSLFYIGIKLICLIRTSLNRIKFNELMITA